MASKLGAGAGDGGAAGQAAVEELESRERSLGSSISTASAAMPEAKARTLSASGAPRWRVARPCSPARAASIAALGAGDGFRGRSSIPATDFRMSSARVRIRDDFLGASDAPPNEGAVDLDHVAAHVAGAEPARSVNAAALAGLARKVSEVEAASSRVGWWPGRHPPALGARSVLGGGDLGDEAADPRRGGGQLLGRAGDLVGDGLLWRRWVSEPPWH